MVSVGIHNVCIKEVINRNIISIHLSVYLISKAVKHISIKIHIESWVAHLITVHTNPNITYIEPKSNLIKISQKLLFVQK